MPFPLCVPDVVDRGDDLVLLLVRNVDEECSDLVTLLIGVQVPRGLEPLAALALDGRPIDGEFDSFNLAKEQAYVVHRMVAIGDVVNVLLQHEK